MNKDMTQPKTTINTLGKKLCIIFNAYGTRLATLKWSKRGFTAVTTTEWIYQSLGQRGEKTEPTASLKRQ